MVRYWHSFWLVLCWLCGSLVSPAWADEPVTIATGEWAPWTGSQLKHHGFVNHLVELAFAQQEYSVKFEYYPWTRAYHLVETGALPVASYVYSSRERQKTVLYSDPVTDERIVFFVMKGSKIEVQSLDDLSNYTVGITRGNTYTDEFRRRVADGRITADTANTDLLNFRKLLTHRIDILPASLLQGYKVLRTHFDTDIAQQITVLDMPLTNTTGHLMFSREQPGAMTLQEAFNAGLQTLRDSGQYETLYNDMLEGAYDPNH